jgi:Kef-type K+ transport system membrane component KefB
VATVGKVVGAGLPAARAGLSLRAAAAIGVGMNARGAVELIVADVALGAGLFDRPAPPPPEVTSLYSSVVITALLTTLATPVGLRALLGRGGTDADGDAGDGRDDG